MRWWGLAERFGDGILERVARQGVVDERLQDIDVRFAKACGQRDVRSAEVEALVLVVPAGELRADGIPGELEELDPLLCRVSG